MSDFKIKIFYCTECKNVFGHSLIDGDDEAEPCEILLLLLLLYY